MDQLFRDTQLLGNTMSQLLGDSEGFVLTAVCIAAAAVLGAQVFIRSMANALKQKGY